MIDITDHSAPCEWRYYSKGNANALFRYNGQNPEFLGKLLRVRLKKDIEDYVSTIDVFNFSESSRKQLGLQQLLKLQLVQISQDFLLSLDFTNCDLMISETFALLIPDVLRGRYTRHIMSKNCSIHVGIESNENTSSVPDTVIVEFKPKWLYKNRSNYCRTCSLNQYKNHKRHFCPLDFLHEESIDRGVDDLMHELPLEVKDFVEQDCHFSISTVLKIFIRRPGCPLRRLEKLQDIKSQSDLENLSSEKSVSESMILSMALRDVGLFIKLQKKSGKVKLLLNDQQYQTEIIHLSEGATYYGTAYIYDLDLKSAKKFRHWEGTANKLKNIHNSYDPNWRLCVGATYEGFIE